MNRQLSVLPGIVLALGLAGCGGTDPLTKAQFIKRGNAVCQQAEHRAGRTGGTGLEGMVSSQVVNEQAKVAGMAALSPPATLEATFAQYKAVLKQQRATFERFLTVIRAGERPHASLVKREEMQTREEELAGALHLARCVEKIEYR